MESSQNNPICQQCGKPLGAKAVQGMCPACLMQAGWPTAEQMDLDGEPSQFIPPAKETLQELFPQLEILELIGRGGMGAVYKARQPHLDRLVALKILAKRSDSDPGFDERFTREARALAKLSHPNIVAVHDYGQAGELSYFVMEYVDGPNLREIQQAGELKPPEALKIVPQICAALQYAHDEGIVHRDIKPENILLDRKGHVKIADFGLAKLLGQEQSNFTLTQDNQVMGTPHYMAPEQVEHPQDVDHRADIYSLGVVFYEMLTGELPLGKFAPPSRKVQVDVRLDEVVLRTLEKEPEQRYQQVSQVKTEVETIVATVSKKEKKGQGIDQGIASKEQISALKRSLRIPALGLFVSGILNLALLCIATIVTMSQTTAEETLQNTTLKLGAFLLLFFSVLIVLWGSFCMRRLVHYRVAVDAAVVAILICGGSGIGLIFGIWALVLLTRKDVHEAFASRNKRPPALTNWKNAWLAALWTTLVHAVELGLVGWVCVYYVPRVQVLLAEIVGGALNPLTITALRSINYLKAQGLALFVIFVLLDGSILLLLSAYGYRLALRLWSIFIAVILLLYLSILYVAIGLPVMQIKAAFNTENSQQLNSSNTITSENRNHREFLSSWENRMVAMNEGDWRKALSIAYQVEALPPQKGIAVVREYWDTVTNPECRKQFLKAFTFKHHPYLVEVLDRGLNDPAPKVQAWALSYLQDVSLQDFSGDYQAGQAWLATRRDQLLETVLAGVAQNLVMILESGDLEVIATWLQAVEHSMFKEFPQTVEGCGLEQALERLIQGRDTNLSVRTLTAAGNLPLSDDWVQRVLLPKLDANEPEEVRLQAVKAIGATGRDWTVDALLDYLCEMVTEPASDHRSEIWSAASSLADIGSARAIPTMIAVIEVDNTYDTVYGVGYFGLGKLTGVSYDEKHDGAWWRQWWTQNKQRFSPDVQGLEIPELSVPQSTLNPIPALWQDVCQCMKQLQTAADHNKLMIMHLTFDQLNEVLDEMQGKNDHGAPSTAQWKALTDTPITEITAQCHGMENSAEMCRDLARGGRADLLQAQWADLQTHYKNLRLMLEKSTD